MCLAFMQSEHMKELLFTIHPIFFNLTTPDVVKGQRHRVSQQGGRRGWTWGRWDPAVASPRPHLTLDQPAVASSSLATVAGGTDGDELRWRRTTTEEGLPVRAWGLEKRGSYPGEVGAAVGPRNQRTAWLLRWICGSGNGFLLSPCLAQQGRKKEKCRGRERENGEGRGKHGSSSAFMHLGRGGDGRRHGRPRGASVLHSQPIQKL